MKKNDNMTTKNMSYYFKYVMILGVIIVPFMYSFFYLKAYWNPYGPGNIDNIPVAVVNEDSGVQGKNLISGIKEKKKLKLIITTEEKALTGLNNGKYYAVISIPEDFTQNMESVNSSDKKHATITYSPNQKTNYLASQIIDNVVNVVESNLNNKVNSTIISELSDTIETIPDNLQTIGDGFTELKSGTEQLSNGSDTLASGISSLKDNYCKFNDGVKSIKEGMDTLSTASEEFSIVNDKIDKLTTGIEHIQDTSNEVKNKMDNYISDVNNALNYTQNLVDIIKQDTCPKVINGEATQQEQQLCIIAQELSKKQETTESNIIDYIKEKGVTFKENSNLLNFGLNEINSLYTVKNKINQLQEGINQLQIGANTLYNSSLQIQNGINELNNGAIRLHNGLNTLDNSVGKAKDEINSSIDSSKEEIKKVEGLSEYSKEPVELDKEAVNIIPSYGTAFSPFFISISLWVGCLMMFIVFYYDKEERFHILGMHNKNRVQRTLAYHSLITITAIVLGFLLNTLLDFNVTNTFLYYMSIILTANAFMGIMNYLIINMDDIGKFIALLLLVLQLAASGGTFPIETVDTAFRWLHTFLPMTYTINLLKESLVTIQNNLLTNNFLTVLGIFIFFFVLNILNDIRLQRYKNKTR